jgi:4-hydroxythreonine-4-phosphate dehydrogenase
LSNPLPTIFITSGEPAGIGPDVCATLGYHDFPARLIVLCDPDVLAQRVNDLGFKLTLRTLDNPIEAQKHMKGVLQILPIRTNCPVKTGNLNSKNAPYVLRQLEIAVELCRANKTAALVTAPIQKSIITEAGIPFTGHTEWLAKQTNSARPVMMLVSDSLRVALATTHLPLDKVSESITQDLLKEIITVLHYDLISKFGVKSPRIMVLGLNPHAGESGTLGKQELEIITPVLTSLSKRGFNLVGPIPADTAFRADLLKKSDAVLAMYHDQGLPVIKALAFGKVVNVTLGLPIIRTSVDHGTALELAGTGHAQASSLLQATELAINLVNRCR